MEIENLRVIRNTKVRPFELPSVAQHSSHVLSQEAVLAYLQ